MANVKQIEAKRTEIKEAEDGRSVTRSGRDYGPSSTMIREARFAPTTSAKMQRTISEAGLPRLSSIEAPALSSVGATFGSKDPSIDPMTTKVAWENYETSLLSSTMIPKEKTATAKEVAEIRVQLTEITKL